MAGLMGQGVGGGGMGGAQMAEPGASAAATSYGEPGSVGAVGGMNFANAKPGWQGRLADAMKGIAGAQLKGQAGGGGLFGGGAQGAPANIPGAMRMRGVANPGILPTPRLPGATSGNLGALGEILARMNMGGQP